ncbi:MAG TPA: putative quinol monooxygenase [Acidimicrobiales bacterium]|jgi:quinol monooxygenase YgiN|nr:putative quinol monooxygenase [Acidimicrobiales bacterium]
MNDRVMIATIVTHPGKRDELAKVFSEMFPVAANEPGTMLYTLIEGDQPDTLYFYEHYRDQAAMDTHLGGEVLTALRGKMGALIASGDAVTGTVVQKIR